MDKRLRPYLLGQLSEVEREALEEDYFINQELFEQLLIVEEELIYAYAEKRLSATEQLQMEQQKFFDSAKRQQKLAMAQTVAAYITRSIDNTNNLPVRESTVKAEKISLWQSLISRLGISFNVWQVSMATLILIMVVAGAWLYRETIQVNQNLAFTLTPIVVRGEEDTNILKITPDTTVELKLKLDRQIDYINYRAELETATGTSIWQQNNLKVQTDKNERYLVARLPEKLLVSGDYLIHLSASNSSNNWEDIAYYPFKIELKNKN